MIPFSSVPARAGVEARGAGLVPASYDLDGVQGSS